MIGLIAGASTVTGVVLKLPVGAISDAIGRRAVLLTAGAVFALTPFVYPLIGSLTVLLLAGWLFGAQMLTTILSRPVFGRVSDCVGRQPMILLGLVTCGLAVAALSLAETL